MLGRWCVPVPDHLCGEDHVESEARNESVEDGLVVDFLESGKDAREGSEEVVEDLGNTVAISIPLQGACGVNMGLP